jgi:hypothetical protein
MPIKHYEQEDISGLRGKGYQEVKNAGLDNGQIIKQNKELHPFGSSNGKYPITPQAKAAEDVDHGVEGPVRSRQADKSSKGKQ